MTLPHIYTIGYESAAIEDLVAALKSAGIARVLDIRHSPYSRRPEFSKDEFRATLAEYGIAYDHLRELGNPPAGREAARAGHMAAYREIFTSHLDSETGRSGLDRALALASAEPVCLLCFEKSANHCHRSMVVARMQAASGQEVVHLRPSTKLAHPAQGVFEF